MGTVSVDTDMLRSSISKPWPSTPDAAAPVRRNSKVSVGELGCPMAMLYGSYVAVSSFAPPSTQTRNTSLAISGDESAHLTTCMFTVCGS